MTKNREIYGTQEDYTPLTTKRYTMKTCSISGRKFKANSFNFYTNRNSSDGYHPYHKEFDNFRRSTGASVDKVRQLVKLINQ